MQLADDAALGDAIYADRRVIAARVEFDWYRDGSYAHPYSDLSTLVQSVSSDRQMQGDLPREVNTMVGYASAELQCTLAGNRTADELSAPRLFSPYETDSPLYGYRVPDTPVRYSRVVYTSDGARIVRQFTGVVRSLEISRDTSEVKITAQDNVDIAQSSVTLPRWARVFTGNGAAARPIDTTWVVEEVLRQSGRPTGPRERADALAYVTCNGGFLPSVGHVGNDFQVPMRRHFITNDVAEPFAYSEDSPYGASYPVLNTGAAGGNGVNVLRRNGANISAARALIVPDAGKGQTPVTVAFALWVYSNGATSGYQGDYFTATLCHLEDFPRPSAQHSDEYHTYGAAQLVVYRNGTIDVTVREVADRSGRREWTFSRTARLAAGWHYVAAHVDFGNTSIGARLWVDDVAQSYSSSSGAGGYRYTNFNPARQGRTNLVQTIVNIPSQHVQVYGGATSVTDYVVGQGDAPLTADGKPLARATASLTELAYLPDVTMRHGWELLQELANAEFGVVHTDEHGVVNYVSHPFLRLDVDAARATPLRISDDTLLGCTINPTTDQYRNAISLAFAERWGIRALIWKAENAWDYWIDVTTDADPRAWNMSTNDDVISVRCAALPRITSAQADNGGENIYEGGVAAITWQGAPQEPTSTSAATGAWSATTYPHGLPRGFQIQAVSPSMRVTWAFLPGNEAALFVGGTRYSELQYVRDTFSDASEVARVGTRMLELSENEWRQTRPTAEAITSELLRDTTVPAPLIDGVSIPSDPRLQLRDIVKIENQAGITGAIFAQVIGINRTDDSQGSRDALTLRVIVTPGQWILDDEELSILDYTTVLG